MFQRSSFGVGVNSVAAVLHPGPVARDVINQRSTACPCSAQTPGSSTTSTSGSVHLDLCGMTGLALHFNPDGSIRYLLRHRNCVFAPWHYVFPFLLISFSPCTSSFSPLDPCGPPLLVWGYHPRANAARRPSFLLAPSKFPPPALPYLPLGSAAARYHHAFAFGGKAPRPLRMGFLLDSVHSSN